MKTEVERLFEALDGLDATDLRQEIEKRMADPASHLLPPPRSRSRRLAAVAAALIAFAAAAVFAWEAFEGVDRERPATTPDPWSWAPEGWTELPLPPEVREGAAIVWAEDELVYWGGWPRGGSANHARADGFVFDPEARSWHPMPPAPIAGGGENVTRDERGGAKAVWTGEEVIFWDVATADAATSATLAFDPDTRTWRRLDDALRAPICCGAWAWTGRELVVFGGGERDAPTTVDGAALDPATGTWRRIADAPIGVNLANAAWTGEEVVVVGSELDNWNIAETQTAVAIAYLPDTDTWRRLPDPPISPQASEAVRFQGRVIAWDYNADSAQYLPAEDRWQGLGRQPLDHWECYIHGVALRGAVLSWDCGYPDAWYPGIGWVDVEGGPAFDVPVDAIVGSQGRLIAAGSVAVLEHVENIRKDGEVYIGSSDAPVRMWIWRPLTSPEPPLPPTAEDAEYHVARFLGAWSDGLDPYLPTLATQEVIDGCRDGVGGCAPLGGGGFGDWRQGEVVETAPGIFGVHIELRPDDGPNVPQAFVVGPGEAADGGNAELVVLDVRSGANPAQSVATFEPAEGWHVVNTSIDADVPIVWAANVPFSPSESTGGFPSETIRNLPAEGIVITVVGPREYAGDTVFPPATFPLTVSQGFCRHDQYETQPAPHVAKCLVDTMVGDEVLNVTVWFGTNRPSDETYQEADAELARLVLPGA